MLTKEERSKLHQLILPNLIPVKDRCLLLEFRVIDQLLNLFTEKEQKNDSNNTIPDDSPKEAKEILE